MEGNIPFLDALVTRKNDGSMKVQVYCKKTHTDQYLNFGSHHPIQHKLSIIRTLYDWCDNIVTDPEDAKAEVEHVNSALEKCGYPSWTFKKVQQQLDKQNSTHKKPKNKKDADKKEEKSPIMVTIPYVKGVLEALAWAYQCHSVSVVMKPHLTYACTPKGQKDTPWHCRGSLSDPLLGLPESIHRRDRQEIHCQREWAL